MPAGAVTATAARTPHLEQARIILNRHLPQLSSGDFSQIMRRTRLDEEQLKDALALIQTLDPNPGETFAPEDVEYVVPDVFVSKKEGRWLVELNPDIAPQTAYQQRLRQSHKAC